MFLADETSVYWCAFFSLFFFYKNLDFFVQTAPLFHTMSMNIKKIVLFILKV